MGVSQISGRVDPRGDVPTHKQQLSIRQEEAYHASMQCWSQGHSVRGQGQGFEPPGQGRDKPGKSRGH